MIYLTELRDKSYIFPLFNIFQIQYTVEHRLSGLVFRTFVWNDEASGYLKVRVVFAIHLCSISSLFTNCTRIPVLYCYLVGKY